LPKSWNDDPPGSLQEIEANVAALGPRFQADVKSRPVPTVAMAQEWHRALFAGVELPEPYYAGEIRDSDPQFPELYGYEVRVGGAIGVPSQDVPAELAQLETRIQAVCSRLDAAIPNGELPPDDATLQAVTATCANVHGEWIRIHPFANGNGRTARLWATWIGLRYRLPTFIVVMPRPAGEPYEAAAAASMRGDHRLCALLFEQMLRAKLGQS
jgi:fido (protein-threonine AMPylation protein)